MHTFDSRSQSTRFGPLPKGKACVNCKRRKVRCDGLRPFCSPCLSIPGAADDCEYTEGGPSRMQSLEDSISRLQKRIRDLEGSSSRNAAPVLLHHPYAQIPPGNIPTPRYSPPDSPCSSSSRSSGGSAHSGATACSTSGSLEPPPEIVQILVDRFLADFHQVGFFLHVDRFRQSALLPLPAGHHARPSSALLNAVYLWGAHFLRPNPPPGWTESIFLTRAINKVFQDLGSQHPRKILHVIQAQTLISLYMLNSARAVEGIYHSSASVSLAISSELHLIPSSRRSHLGQGEVEPRALPSAADAVDEGERINAFWTVLIVNNYWVASHGSPSAMPCDVPVDTPWPLEMSEYTITSFSDIQSRRTIESFLNGASVVGFSSLALLAKASILLERAAAISLHHTPDAREFQTLDVVIDRFQNSLPLPDEIDVGPSAKRSLLVTQTLTHAAAIQLHAPFARSFELSREKSFAAIRSVAQSVRSTNLRVFQHIDPIMAILWLSASDTIIIELTALNECARGSRIADRPQELVRFLDSIGDAMAAFASNSPLFDKSSSRIREVIEVISSRS